MSDPNSNEDKLTLLEDACIRLKVPASGSKWLDDLIWQARKLDTLQAAGAGLCGKSKTPDGSPVGVTTPTTNRDVVIAAEEFLLHILFTKSIPYEDSH